MKNYKEMAESVLRRRDEYNQKRRRDMKRIAMALSCLCLAALLGAGVWHSPAARPSKNNVEIAKMPMIKTEDQRDAQEGFDAGGLDNGGADVSSTTTIDVPMPMSPDPGGTGALTPYEEVWGGSYMDERGRWVVLLTKDTPENRQKVFDLNPQLGSDTIFREAKYSYAYLKELMARVSAAHLPDLSGTGLRLDWNRVGIYMTAENRETEAKLRALDTLGGALEFVVIGDQAALTEDLIK